MGNFGSTVAQNYGSLFARVHAKTFLTADRIQ